VYLPLFLLPGQARRHFHLPVCEITTLRLLVRRCSRATWALHLALQEGFDLHMMKVLQAR
jgi:hypothetical protein